MKTIQAISSKNGQTTIPSAVRKRLGLTGAGTFLWVLDQDEIQVRPAESNWESAFGSIPFPLETDEIEEAIHLVRGDRAAQAIKKLN